MKLYELATLRTVIFGAGKAAPAIKDYVSAPEAKGKLLGAWASDIGRLNEVFILREFDSRVDLDAERERARRSSNPFGCAELLTGMDLDSYAPLGFLPPVETGDFGPFYEIRTYRMKPNGLGPTEEKWRDAVPTRTGYSPLTIAMYSIDGGSRFTQIWPYRSLEERGTARGKSVADGVWPPKGGPDWLTPDMYSTIAMPLAFSPLK
ncbi:NIPSNAP family protein [Aquamicrobium sp. LC103]|uniref:NIPSNAP family protein n=1 Tax=Aquamicrobium sp. LC103 TaxID=1120658 RepID=UPI0010C9F1C0|nr:NIPSNAP family protein [Aquamicrobium sp. LC103]TKT76187.1 NIPSNAP family protein [Aquamicrobium sp. LC103]